MAKLTLVPEPLFWAKLDVPVPGAEAMALSLQLKHRTKTELQTWLETGEGREDVQALLDLVAAWDLPDLFCAENISLLCENHIGIAGRIVDFYIQELTKAKRGN